MATVTIKSTQKREVERIIEVPYYCEHYSTYYFLNADSVVFSCYTSPNYSIISKSITPMTLINESILSGKEITKEEFEIVYNKALKFISNGE